MGLLTREEILAAADRPTEVVQVPEWGGDVIVSTMSGEARDSWEQSLLHEGKGKVNLKNVRARLVSRTAVDEHGQLLFSLEDVEALGAKSAAALDRCAKVAQRLNKLTEEELETAKGN